MLFQTFFFDAQHFDYKNKCIFFTNAIAIYLIFFLCALGSGCRMCVREKEREGGNNRKK